jgi:hypothetical protein
MSKNGFHRLRFLGLRLCLAFTVFAALPAYADAPGPNECYLSPNQTEYNCNAAAVNGAPTQALTSTSTYLAGRSDPATATFPIDIAAYNRCRYVDNSSTNSYFIPFRSQPEWMALLTDTTPPTGLGFTHCSRATTYTIYPGPRCASPSPASMTVNLPYARYPNGGPGATQTTTAKFTCAFPGSAIPQKWYETATVQFTGLDSDVSNPSWSEGAVTYTGSPN